MLNLFQLTETVNSNLIKRTTLQVVDALLSKVVKDFSALLVSQGTQVAEYYRLVISISSLEKCVCFTILYLSGF